MQNPEAVLSPVDGRIVVVERARDPYRDVDALKISIFMKVLFGQFENAVDVFGCVDARYAESAVGDMTG